MESLDQMIERAGLSLAQAQEALSVSRSTLHLWRSKNQIPPSRVKDFADLVNVAETAVPTAVRRDPQSSVTYQSLASLPESFREELGGYASEADQITLLGLAGVYALEELPLFKERAALAIAMGTLEMRILIASPESPYALARAAEEGYTDETYNEAVGFALRQWEDLLKDKAPQSIRFYSFWPAIMLYRFGAHGILSMPHLPETDGYELPAVWHKVESLAFGPYSEFLDRAWNGAIPAIES